MPVPRSRRWTAREERILLPYIENGMHWRHAAERFPDRAPGAVQAKWFSIIRNGPKAAADGQAEPEEIFDLNRLQDENFQLAMRKAISAGLENPSIGVFKAKDNEEFRPVAFAAGMRTSGCSSSAALCAEIGDVAGAFK